MDIKVINQDEGIKKLAYLACDRCLIPFFGSGFTSGCESFRKKVPNGKSATKIMNDIIINTSFGKIKKNELSDNFNETSDLFLKVFQKKSKLNSCQIIL